MLAVIANNNQQVASASAVGSWAGSHREFKDRRFAWGFWALLLVMVCMFVAFGPKRSVTPAYAGAALSWLAGEPLYSDTGTGFLYLPPAAVLFLPFATLPTLLADVLWRCFTVGTFAWGVFRLSALAEKSSPFPLFGLVTLISVPMVWSSAQNGQATLPMAGLMMIAVANLSTHAWWRAAGCLALAVSVKPLALVLILLSAALYRPMIARLLVALSVALAAPFLAQDPRYVLSQYLDFKRMIGLAADHGNLDYFAQVFGLLRVAGFEVPQNAQTLLCVVFAGLTLAACYHYSRRLEAPRWGVYFYALTGCYLMLFNTRTENNTYSLLAPAIAIFLSQASVVDRKPLRSVLLGIVALGTFGTYEIGRLFTPPEQSVWLAPLMCIVFSLCIITDLLRGNYVGRPHLVAEPLPDLAHLRKAA